MSPVILIVSEREWWSGKGEEWRVTRQESEGATKMKIVKEKWNDGGNSRGQIVVRKPGRKEAGRNVGGGSERYEGTSFVSLLFGIQKEKLDGDVHDIPISIDPRHEIKMKQLRRQQLSSVILIPIPITTPCIFFPPSSLLLFHNIPIHLFSDNTSKHRKENLQSTQAPHSNHFRLAHPLNTCHPAEELRQEIAATR